MKTTFQIDINPASIKTFFPEERIKDKYKILEILLEACRYILYNNKLENVNGTYKLILCKDKMSRLFFVGENKIYSISFPFNIYYSPSITSINYKNLLDIDSYHISLLLSIIKSPSINSENCLDFIDPIVDITQQNFWTTFRDLLILEDGYIRYDKDEVGFQEAKEKLYEDRHPLNHIDIFYTNQATLKLGLDKEYADVDFIDMTNTNTNCKYLNHR